jgi:hypothetical protein
MSPDCWTSRQFPCRKQIGLTHCKTTATITFERISLVRVFVNNKIQDLYISIYRPCGFRCHSQSFLTPCNLHIIIIELYITQATEFQLCMTYSGTHQKLISHGTWGSACQQLHIRESQHQIWMYWHLSAWQADFQMLPVVRQYCAWPKMGNKRSTTGQVPQQ